MMEKLFVMMVCLFSTLFAEDPKETSGESRSLVVQEMGSQEIGSQEMASPDQPLLTSPFPYYFKRMLISLALLIGLLVLTVWALKRLMRSREKGINEQKKIKILEKRVLSSKSLLYLVEVEGEKVLLSESHLEIRPLHAFKNEEQIE